MSTSETTLKGQYEGWTNRETWAVALHINNDQGWQESVLEALRDLTSEINEGRPRDTEVSAHTAGLVIRANVEATLDPGEAPDADLSHALACLDALASIGSLWRVDWDELGAAFLADLAE